MNNMEFQDINNVKISVIVPIYNAQKYINNCIESILKQNYNKFELILVDDGSTDLTKSILENYSKEYSRIKIITKDNGEVSSARNIGIKYATGEWITFVDADDVLSSNYLSNLIKPCAKFPLTELIISGYKHVNRNNFEITQKVIYNRQYSTDAVGCFFNNLNVFHFYPFFPYSKLYKTAIIKKHKISLTRK